MGEEGGEEVIKANVAERKTLLNGLSDTDVIADFMRGARKQESDKICGGRYCIYHSGRGERTNRYLPPEIVTIPVGLQSRPVCRSSAITKRTFTAILITSIIRDLPTCSFSITLDLHRLGGGMYTSCRA